jgi:ferredoxin/flavodoxin---NADP+ reductase
MGSTPDKFQKVRIVQRRDHTKDLWTIRIAPEEPLVFKPGQYATLGMNTGAKLLERAYSIVSSPLESEIEFFFELVQDGALTPRLYELREGDTFLMRRQAKGLFTLDTKSGHANHYMVSTVTGVAPFVSMARTEAREAEKGTPPGGRMVLLQAASRSWELAYDEELRRLAASSPWLEYIPTISRPWEDTAWQGEVGRAEDVLRKHFDRMGLAPETTTAYLCGHPIMIENAQGILQRRGFKKEFIREEVYWMPKKTT